MKEKIIAIEEIDFKKGSDSYPEFSGYQVVTEAQTIKFGIENRQNCCETWGYLSSEDDFNDFIGAGLLEIIETDIALHSIEHDLKEDYIGIDECMFITFKTSKGDFQFAAYNSHNGYYGHSAVLISRDKNLEECL